MRRVPTHPARRVVHGRDLVTPRDAFEVSTPGTDVPGIDVIGDVHGAFEHLEALLDTLGYHAHGTSRRHPDGRHAVFVGDLIDRGTGQIETLRLVRSMVETGDATCVLGNHEYNAISWYHGLRSRDEHRRRQHEAFLDAVGEGSRLHTEIVEWFTTLPLILETHGARIVHACWDPEALVDISPLLTGGGALTEEGFVRSNDRDHAEGRIHRAVEHLLKGPEIDLPANAQYVDKDGKLRSKARYAWWNTTAERLADACVIPSGVLGTDGEPHRWVEDHPVVEAPSTPYRDPEPVLVGHYWRSGNPEPLTEKVACVDYSAVKGGALCAYRYDGESSLHEERFVSVRPARGAQ